MAQRIAILPVSEFEDVQAQLVRFVCAVLLQRLPRPLDDRRQARRPEKTTSRGKTDAIANRCTTR